MVDIQFFTYPKRFPVKFQVSVMFLCLLSSKMNMQYDCEKRLIFHTLIVN